MLLALVAALGFMTTPGREQNVLGTLYFGPESMLFVACGAKEYLWLNGQILKSPEWSAVQYVLDAQPRCDLDTMPCTPQRVIVAGMARISQAGTYGHLGHYTREVTFLTIQIGSQNALEACENDT
ncbi:MAG: hypothetical protein U1F26_06005 [Lysobacterales bacterium]